MSAFVRIFLVRTESEGIHKKVAGSEAVNMLFTQFNLEDAKKIWQEEAYEDGEEAGIQRGIEQGIRQGDKLVR